MTIAKKSQIDVFLPHPHPFFLSSFCPLEKPKRGSRKGAFWWASMNHGEIAVQTDWVRSFWPPDHLMSHPDR